MGHTLSSFAVIDDILLSLQTFSVYRDIPGGLQSSENVPPAAVTAHAQPTLTRAASSVAAGAAPTPLLLQPAASRAPSVPSFAIYNDENSAPIQQVGDRILDLMFQAMPIVLFN